jgi:hypothetical protein
VARRFVLPFLAVSLSFALAAVAREAERMTPLLLAVQNAPVPFTGSDGRTHLVYELWLTNFSSGDATVEGVEVRGDGALLATLDAVAVATRLQPAGERSATGTMAPSSTALLFLHVALEPGATIPRRLEHRVAGRFAAAPPGQQQISETGGAIDVDRGTVVAIGPPLRGDRYIAADSCCDSTRHTRAALPVNGAVRIAQRFAVDWEQLDDGGRIYAGPREELRSYTIFGREAIAVADATVASVLDGLPEQTPGTYPEAIALDQADGNSVILDLGGGRFALYAHLQPGSLRVRPGNAVKRGQPLGLVGNSGNSLAPHLHFHVMDGPSPLASNGLPYEIVDYQITGHSPGTAAFDVAEEKGTPLSIAPAAPPLPVKRGLPLDQSLVRFAP